MAVVVVAGIPEGNYFIGVTARRIALIEHIFIHLNTWCISVYFLNNYS